MQAATKGASEKIFVEPVDLPRSEKYEFQPTSSKGVSFPESQRRPTITVNLDRPSDVQSITIPRDKTPNANVERFEVIFFSRRGDQINDQGILSSSSPKGDPKTPARVDNLQIPSNQRVLRVEITIISTTDGKSPKGVVLDIKTCTEMTTST